MTAIVQSCLIILSDSRISGVKNGLLSIAFLYCEATEYVEDYSDYNSSMKAYYKELYDKYDKWLEGGRLKWPDDVPSFL